MTLPSGASAAFFGPNMPAFWNQNPNGGGAAHMPAGTNTMNSPMAFLQNGMPHMQNQQQLREYMSHLAAMQASLSNQQQQPMPHHGHHHNAPGGGSILNGLSLNTNPGVTGMPPPPLPLPQQPPRSLNQHAQPAQLPPHNGQMSTGNGGPISPTFPSFVPVPSPPAGFVGETTTGVGVVTWLSSQAGLISSPTHGTISFQLKEFCDQAVSDLTSVIRPGFRLKYQAVSRVSEFGQQYNANFIVPVHGPDAKEHGNNLQADLMLQGETGPPQLAKDPYDIELEGKAVPMLLNIFERMSVTQCQLGSFHCQISNCGDDNLYKYVGTSSLKRRQFLERRTHLFSINQQDLVSLQSPCIYTTCVCLHRFLLSRGGACLMQECFEHFNSCPDIPLEARDVIGEGKTAFLRFLTSHQWLFAVFPSRVFVSVRRQLPDFDYAAFINEHFPDLESSRSSPGSQKYTGLSSQNRNELIEQANAASKLHGSHGSTSSNYGSGLSSSGGGSGALSPASFAANGPTNNNGHNGHPPSHLQRSNSSSTPGTPLWANPNGGQSHSPLGGFINAATIPENNSISSTRAPSATPIGKLPDICTSLGMPNSHTSVVTSCLNGQMIGGIADTPMHTTTSGGMWAANGIGNGSSNRNADLVGGRIRRFADMNVQTEPMAEPVAYEKQARTIGTQTSVEYRGVSCGTGCDQIDVFSVKAVSDFEEYRPSKVLGCVGSLPDIREQPTNTSLGSTISSSTRSPSGSNGSPNSNYDPFDSGLQFNNLMSAFGTLQFHGGFKS